MKFRWDEEKNQINIRKHGLNFADASEIFDKPMLVNSDDRFDYGEQRWFGLGMINTRIVAVVFTEPDEETIRIISLRKAVSYERKQYEKAFRNRLGTL